MVGPVIETFKQKVASAGPHLTPPDCFRYLSDGFVGPIGFVIYELDIFNADHIVVIANSIINEVLRVFS